MKNNNVNIATGTFRKRICRTVKDYFIPRDKRIVFIIHAYSNNYVQTNDYYQLEMIT